MKRATQLRQSEQGMVSIIVTMIIMSVLSLIVVGFAQLARREQREALDKQLSTQAFYAAESGINDALKAINTEGYTSNKTTCDTTGTPFDGDRQNIGSDGDVSYTCLLIDQRPQKLDYGAIEVDKATVVPINPVDPATDVPLRLTELNISWNRADGNGSGYYSNGLDTVDLPAAGGWGDREAGILRIDLIPLPNGTLSRNNLSDTTFTTFLYPKDSSDTVTTVDYAPNAGSQGSIKLIACNNSGVRKCNASIRNNLPAVEHYYLRITSLYSNSAVTISGKGVAPGDATERVVSFKDGQYIIDSTGKAGDVLKRVRVHTPAGKTDYRYPNYAINSVQDICKRLEVYPGGGTDDCTVATPAPAGP